MLLTADVEELRLVGCVLFQSVCLSVCLSVRLSVCHSSSFFFHTCLTLLGFGGMLLPADGEELRLDGCDRLFVDAEFP